MENKKHLLILLNKKNLKIFLSKLSNACTKIFCNHNQIKAKKQKKGPPKSFFSLSSTFLNFFLDKRFNFFLEHVALWHFVRKSAAHTVPERYHHARLLERPVCPADMCTSNPSVGVVLATTSTWLQHPCWAALLVGLIDRTDFALLCMHVAGFQCGMVVGACQNAPANQSGVFIITPRRSGAVTVLKKNKRFGKRDWNKKNNGEAYKYYGKEPPENGVSMRTVWKKTSWPKRIPKKNQK